VEGFKEEGRKGESRSTQSSFLKKGIKGMG